MSQSLLLFPENVGKANVFVVEQGFDVVREVIVTIGILMA